MLSRDLVGWCSLRFVAVLLAPLIVFVASGSAVASDWVARHGLTATQYQNAFEGYTRSGYRLVSISGYDVGGQARYAALWKKQSGSDWVARHGLTPDQYQAAFDDYARNGYRLTWVNGYSVGRQAYYAAIWSKTGGPAWSARHGLTAAQYQAAFDDMSGKGYAPTHISAFSMGGSPRFAVIFERGAPPTAARHGLSAAQYQSAFEQYAREGYRLKEVTGYRDGNADRYAGLWVRAAGPHWSARHGIPAAHYQAVFDNYRYQSWEPNYIEAFNGADGVRFNALWGNTAFRAEDLKLIDDEVRGYMRAHAIPGMSVAIMRDGRLVFASGYGVADKESGEPVSPTHRFRQASVSKLLTRSAVLKLIAETSLDEGSRIFGSNSELGASYATPARNPKIVGITVGHLIDHRGGFVNVNKDGVKSDPMFAYNGTTQKGLIDWALATYPLGSDPGAEENYSNFGYCLLGRVIENRAGESYEAYVRDALLKPAGARDVVIGGDKLADRKPGEVVYYGGGAYSSVKPTRFDSHGGWIARPMDLLRFMRHEPFLGSSYGHYGEMSGTMSVLRRRSDGFGFAAAVNSSDGSTQAMNAMLTTIVEGVKDWPAGDLF